MDLYPLIRPVLFRLDPEVAHHSTLNMMKFSQKIRLSKLLYKSLPNQPVSVMGLNFSNPVGLAAGLDKNGDYIDAIAELGFGFIEIGTVTPRAQPGNPKPRMFRLPEHHAIINRMGFNNKGVEHLVKQVEQCQYEGIIGINIGKNADTPIELAVDDYIIGLNKAYPHADYVTINISSPNTKNLRQLQLGNEIKFLLDALKREQLLLEKMHQKYVPIVLKIAPDLSTEAIVEIAQLLKQFGIDAIIATNTTLSRQLVESHPLSKQAGGLSGAPIKHKSTEVVRILAKELNGKIPIIAAGGIMNAEDATDKFSAGASLVQIYSGLIYRGPKLVEEIVQVCRI